MSLPLEGPSIAAPPVQPAIAPRTGWQGRLELCFGAGAAGRAGTRLVHNRHAGPLRLLKALESGDGHRLEAVIVHPPGGLVGGDSLALDVRLEDDAQVLVTTPGAQKWYRGALAATSTTRLGVADGAMLEWLPQPSILYDRARVRQALTIELGPRGCCLGWEILIRGRGAMGESIKSGHIDQTLSLSVDGSLLWQESLHADAADRVFESPLGWDGQRIAASVWCCAPAAAPAELQALRERWRALLDPGTTVPPGPPMPSPGVRGGATIAADGLLLAKLLADDGERLMTLCRQFWRAARLSLHGHEGSTPRIWRT